MAEPRPVTTSGPVSVTIALYSLLALAATGRAAVQLAGHPGQALFAYLMTTVAAAAYLAAAVLLRLPAPRARVAARRVCAAELAGVLAVGTFSLARPDWFPEASVWSGYGVGYGFLPLVLPAATLWLTAPARDPQRQNADNP